jgi:hypothetical protein
VSEDFGLPDDSSSGFFGTADDKPSASFGGVFGGVFGGLFGVGDSTIFLSWSRKIKIPALVTLAVHFLLVRTEISQDHFPA